LPQVLHRPVEIATQSGRSGPSPCAGSLNQDQRFRGLVCPDIS
jgi:hypothetical protein